MYEKADLSALNKIANGDHDFIRRLLDAFDDELIFFQAKLSEVNEKKDCTLLRPAFHKIRPTLDMLSLRLLIRQIELLQIAPGNTLDESVELVASGIRHLRDELAEARGL